MSLILDQYPSPPFDDPKKEKDNNVSNLKPEKSFSKTEVVQSLANKLLTSHHPETSRTLQCFLTSHSPPINPTSLYRILLDLPEALAPSLYYDWVLQLSSCTDDISFWHLQRASLIDKATGRYDLIFSLFTLGHTHLKLQILSVHLQRLPLVEHLSILDPENFLFEDSLSWSAFQLVQQIRSYDGPAPLILDFLYNNDIITSNCGDNWLDVLNLPIPDTHYVIYAKLCIQVLLCHSNSPTNIKDARKVIHMLDKRTAISSSNNDCSATISISQEHLRSVNNLSDIAPLYRLLSEQMKNWEIIGQYSNVAIPSLAELINSKCRPGRASTYNLKQHQLIKEILAHLNNEIEEDLDFINKVWENLQLLAHQGYFDEGVQLSQLFRTLVQEVIDGEHYATLPGLISFNDASNLLDSETLEQLLLSSSREKFNSSLQVDLSQLNIINFLDASPSIDRWRQFLQGAHALQTEYRNLDDVQLDVPLPIEIHHHPQRHLHQLIRNPKCYLFKNQNRVDHISQLLMGTVDGEAHLLMVDRAIQSADYSTAYSLCLIMLTNSDNDLHYELLATRRLVEDDNFPDLDKRFKLVSLGLSKCDTVSCLSWVALYRKLEVILMTLPTPDNNSEDSKNILKHHPMYTSDISSLGDDLYDGTESQSPSNQLERAYRLTTLTQPCNESLRQQSQIELIRGTNDMTLAEFHLLDLPGNLTDQLIKEKLIEYNEKNSPDTAFYLTYHHCLATLPYIRHKDSSNVEHDDDLTRLPPRDVLATLKLNQWASKLTLADQAYRQIQHFTQFKELAKLLAPLSIDPEVFQNSPLTGQFSLLEAQTSNIELPDQLHNLLQIAHNLPQLSHHQPQLVLAYTTHFLTSTLIDPYTVDAHWQKEVVPHLHLLTQLEEGGLKEYMSIHSKLRGDNFALRLVFYQTLLDIFSSNLDENTEEQVLLRIDVLNYWMDHLPSDCILDFKATLSSLFTTISSEESRLVPLLNPLVLLDPRHDQDGLLYHVSKLAKLKPVFDDELNINFTDARWSEVELISSLYWEYFVVNIDNLINKDPTLLFVSSNSDNDSDEINLEFITDYSLPLLTHTDLTKLIELVCGVKYGDKMPYGSARYLLDYCDRLLINSEQYDMWKTGLFDQLHSRLTTLDKLSELTDPITEEDLGFLTLQLIDQSISIDDPVDVLIGHLLDHNIGLWLLYEVIIQLCPNSLVSYEELIGMALINQITKDSAQIKGGLSRFGQQLLMYKSDGRLVDWADSLLVTVHDLVTDQLDRADMKVEIKLSLIQGLVGGLELQEDDDIMPLLDKFVGIIWLSINKDGTSNEEGGWLDHPDYLIECLINYIKNIDNNVDYGKILRLLLILTHHHHKLGLKLNGKLALAWVRFLIHLNHQGSRSFIKPTWLWEYLNLGSLLIDDKELVEILISELKPKSDLEHISETINNPWAEYYLIRMSLSGIVSDQLEKVLLELGPKNELPVAVVMEPRLLSLITVLGGLPVLITHQTIIEDQLIGLMSDGPYLNHPVLQHHAVTSLSAHIPLARRLATSLRFRFAPSLTYHADLVFSQIVDGFRSFPPLIDRPFFPTLQFGRLSNLLTDPIEHTPFDELITTSSNGHDPTKSYIEHIIAKYP